jgi:hypothetical protein
MFKIGIIGILNVGGRKASRGGGLMTAMINTDGELVFSDVPVGTTVSLNASGSLLIDSSDSSNYSINDEGYLIYTT